MKKADLYNYFILFFLLPVFILSGCTDKNTESNLTGIAVTNSYLQCIVAELSGADIEIFSLAPPGMCPGHFDITPAQTRQLRNCTLLILFDFQSQVESSLSGLKSKGLKTALVAPLPGLCIPATYLDTCRQVCNILAIQFPQNQDNYRHRLSQIETRLNTLSLELTAQIDNAGLTKTKVLASMHQSEFVNWLGLETIAVFAGSDAETASNINDCLKKAQDQDVKFIIANRQEGTALADALADRLNAQTVVFSNFPLFEAGKTGFDKLLRDNIALLTRKIQK
jgi:zinc transport system substrate-binding protein